jgi:hypothetical protein
MNATPRGEGSRLRSKKVDRKLAKEKLESDWRDFSHLAGTHLSRTTPHPVSRGLRLLSDSDGTVRVSATRERQFSNGYLYRSDGRTYAWRQVGKRNPRVYDLVDATSNIAILQKSGSHFGGKATTRVILEDEFQLEFPVRRGTRWHSARAGANRHSLMSAVDAAGNHLIEYRWVEFNPVVSEIVIRPSALAIPNIEIIAAISVGWLHSFFATGGSGS